MLAGKEGRLFSLSRNLCDWDSAAESLVCPEILVALGTEVTHVMEGVEIAGEERAETAAETAQEAGGEPGEHPQFGLRLGEDEEAAVRTLSVQRSRPQPSLRHLDTEGNVVEEGHHRAALHTRHLTLLAASVERGFHVVGRYFSLPLPLLALWYSSVIFPPGPGLFSQAVLLYNPCDSLGL